MANTYLERTFSAGNRKTWTMSAWIKRSSLSSHQRFFVWGSGGYGLIWEGSDRYDALRTYVAVGSNSEFLTNRLFRDTNAWYHIVLKIDTTQSTAADRMRLYINGVEETSFASRTYPNQNEDTSINQAGICRLGVNTVALNSYFDGSMSHVHFIDGTAYDATAFGEYDANGVWKIKTSPSVTYGTNGFFILKDGNSVTDQSGNGNNFTVAGGTLTNTEDNPSNVFATLNPLAKGSSSTFSNGNLTCTTGGANNTSTSTIGVSSGKWYWEYKLPSGSLNYVQMGITTNESSAANTDVMTNFSGANYVKTAYAAEFRYNTDGGAYSTDTYGGTQSVNDIFQIALDLENSFIYMGVNGTYFNSGDPTSGASGTGAAKAIVSGLTYFPMMITLSNNMSINFGNGYFGTTAVASAGTNASGNGIFEYDCPDGYTALSTKGLNL